MPDQPPSEPEKFVPMRPPTPRRYYSEREMREEKKRELARPVVWEESKKGAKKLNRISSVLLGLALTVLGAAAWLVGRSLTQDSTATIVGREDLPAVTDTAASAQAVMDGFLRSGTIEERLKYVRDPTTVEILMRKYYKKYPIETDEVSKLQVFGKWYSPEKLELFVAKVLTQTAEEKNFLLIKAEDEFRIDWESLVAYCPIDWDQFIETRPSKPAECRVYMTRSDYFNHDFNDSSKFACFRLSHPRSDRGLYGYIAVSNPDFAKIRKLVGTNIKRPAILALRFLEEDRAQDQVVIDSLVNDIWFKP